MLIRILATSVECLVTKMPQRLIETALLGAIQHYPEQRGLLLAHSCACPRHEVVWQEWKRSSTRS